MNRLKAGLAMAVAVGVAVALYPLYAQSLAPLLWSIPGEGGGEEETLTVKGVVEAVDPEAGMLVVDGVRLSVRGYWVAAGGNETLTLYYRDVLASIEPGMHATVEYVESGRWGAMAEEIRVEELGVTFVKSE